jgi:hypothetical protein
VTGSDLHEHRCKIGGSPICMYVGTVDNLVSLACNRYFHIGNAVYKKGVTREAKTDAGSNLA